MALYPPFTSDSTLSFTKPKFWEKNAQDPAGHAELCIQYPSFCRFSWGSTHFIKEIPCHTHYSMDNQAQYSVDHHVLPELTFTNKSPCRAWSMSDHGMAQVSASASASCYQSMHDWSNNHYDQTGRLDKISVPFFSRRWDIFGHCPPMRAVPPTIICQTTGSIFRSQNGIW